MKSVFMFTERWFHIVICASYPVSSSSLLRMRHASQKFLCGSPPRNLVSVKAEVPQPSPIRPLHGCRALTRAARKGRFRVSLQLPVNFLHHQALRLPTPRLAPPLPASEEATSPSVSDILVSLTLHAERATCAIFANARTQWQTQR